MKIAKFKSLGDIQAMAVPCAFATEASRTVEMVFRRLTAPVITQAANAKKPKSAVVFNRARHDQTRDGAQSIYAKALKAFLQKWQLAVLNALHHQRSSVTSIPNDDVEVMVRQMFDLPGWTKIFKAAMFNAAQDAYEFCAKGALSELGDNEHVTDHGITTDFALDRQNKIKDCPQGIFDDIQQSLTEGIRNGETMDELADRVKEGFKDADDDRAYLIARTEAQSAYGTAQFNVLSDAGYQKKMWQTSDDEAVRDSHMACEEQGAIPMDEDFSNGLSYPGDPDGEAGEVINCRCYLTMDTDPDEDEADRMNREAMDNDPEMFNPE